MIFLAFPYFYTVLSVKSSKLLFEGIQRHEVSDRCDVHPIVKQFFSHSVKKRIFHKQSLLNPFFVRCKLFLPEHRRYDISPAAHPVRDRARSVFFGSISAWLLHFCSILFFLDFRIQYLEDVIKYLIESLLFFHLSLILKLVIVYYFSIILLFFELTEANSTCRRNRFLFFPLSAVIVYIKSFMGCNASMVFKANGAAYFKRT